MAKIRDEYKTKAPKKIPTPEIFLFYFEEFYCFVKANPFKVHDFVGKDGDEVHRKKERCLTMDGFQVYMEKEFGIGAIKQYIYNQEGRYGEYVATIEHIKLMIREDQISGGMAGVYNANLTARLQGLSEHIESKGENVKLLNIDPL